VVDVEEGLPPVHANPSRIGQVFLNLLVDAAHAIPHGHADLNQIRVLARTSGDATHVVIDFEDSGAGVPPSVQGRIFDPFFTTKPVGVGTGLAICHQIVQSVQGDIAVTSTLGQGSCFRVTLPATVGAATPVRSPRPAPAPAATVRVLMVDDEAASFFAT
jgi:signal transduction histidine kinase